MTDLSSSRRHTRTPIADGSLSEPGRPPALAGWVRWQPVTGIAFAVVFFVAMFLSNTPDGNASDQKWTSYFASTSHRAALLVSAFLFVVAGLCALGFITSIWSRAAVARPSERPGLLPVLAAAVAAGCIAVGGATNSIIAGAMAFQSVPEPNAEILRIFDSLAFPIITVGGMIALALAIATVSRQARRAGVMGRGLAGFSLVAAIVTVASFVFFPMAITLIWFLVTSVSLLRHRQDLILP